MPPKLAAFWSARWRYSKHVRSFAPQRDRQAAQPLASHEGGVPRHIAKAVIRRDSARYRLCARLSRIHRFGVFAEQAIPAAGKIIENTGQPIGRRESVRRSSRHSTYVFRLDSYWRIDGSVGGSGVELINHCCEPNCRFIRDAGPVWVESLRAIQAGEELTLDYRFPKDVPRTPCDCGAATCRGTINTR